MMIFADHHLLSECLGQCSNGVGKFPGDNAITARPYDFSVNLATDMLAVRHLAFQDVFRSDRHHRKGYGKIAPQASARPPSFASNFW
jgi:hypothetical protein